VDSVQFGVKLAVIPHGLCCSDVNLLSHGLGQGYGTWPPCAVPLLYHPLYVQPTVHMRPSGAGATSVYRCSYGETCTFWGRSGQPRLVL